MIIIGGISIKVLSLELLFFYIDEKREYVFKTGFCAIRVLKIIVKITSNSGILKKVC